MKAFIIIVDGTVVGVGYRSLRTACENAGMSYYTIAKEWNGSYSRKGKTIQELTIVKMKKRGKAINS